MSDLQVAKSKHYLSIIFYSKNNLQKYNTAKFIYYLCRFLVYNLEVAVHLLVLSIFCRIRLMIDSALQSILPKQIAIIM